MGERASAAPRCVWKLVPLVDLTGIDSALPRHNRRTALNLRPGSIRQIQAHHLSLVGTAAPTSAGEHPRPFQLALCRECLAVFIE
jgi:hypothetical protein